MQQEKVLLKVMAGGAVTSAAGWAVFQFAHGEPRLEMALAHGLGILLMVGGVVVAATASIWWLTREIRSLETRVEMAPESAAGAARLRVTNCGRRSTFTASAEILHVKAPQRETESFGYDLEWEGSDGLGRELGPNERASLRLASPGPDGHSEGIYWNELVLDSRRSENTTPHRYRWLLPDHGDGVVAITLRVTITAADATKPVQRVFILRNRQFGGVTVEAAG